MKEVSKERLCCKIHLMARAPSDHLWPHEAASNPVQDQPTSPYLEQNNATNQPSLENFQRLVARIKRISSFRYSLVPCRSVYD